MKLELIEPSVELIYPTAPEAAQDLLRIELAGRTCYKTENRTTGRPFIRMLLKRGHLSVLEHSFASFRIICDRGVSHEIVRHRIASYSQESTRYVNYGKRGLGIISPASAPGFSEMMPPGSPLRDAWERAMISAADSYNEMLSLGAPPELARAVLPNSTKTELVMTANYREWLHFLGLRADKKAHPQMREIAFKIQAILLKVAPDVFEPLTAEEAQ